MFNLWPPMTRAVRPPEILVELLSVEGDRWGPGRVGPRCAPSDLSRTPCQVSVVIHRRVQRFESRYQVRSMGSPMVKGSPSHVWNLGWHARSELMVTAAWIYRLAGAMSSTRYVCPHGWYADGAPWWWRWQDDASDAHGSSTMINCYQWYRNHRPWHCMWHSCKSSKRGYDTINDIIIRS